MYYMLLVEIKYFNALIDNKVFFDLPIKKKHKAFEKRMEISRNDDYTTGNLIVCLYHQIYNKLTGIDLSREANTYSSTN